MSSVQKRQSPPLDPELAPALAAILSAGPGPLSIDRLDVFREMTARIVPSDEALAMGGAVEVSERLIETSDGASLPAVVLRPTAADPVAGIYFLHSGGMVMGTGRTGIEVPLAWVVELGCAVVSVDYRLAPEFPHPTPVEDAYAGLAWMHEHAGELGLPRDRIIVSGSSAGGGLAAGVVLMARDRQGPPLLGQILMGPMLDDRNETPSSQEVIDGSVWDRATNEVAWGAVLGDARGGADVSPYAAPSRAGDLSGLPPAFIDVGSVEVFRDEAVDYAARLWCAGGQAELHVWPGAFHAFDTLVPASRLAVQAAATRASWIERLLSADTAGQDGDAAT